MIYYDNSPIDSVANGHCIIDRVYALSFSEFSKTDWTRLLNIYSRLPGWQGASQEGCACWCGTSKPVPCLFASIEPSGLHVTGELGSDAWSEWHAAFLPFVEDLPHFLV